MSTQFTSPSKGREGSSPPPSSLPFIPPNLQEPPKDQHTLKLYRQMLSKARLPSKHLDYIQDLTRSENQQQHYTTSASTSTGKVVPSGYCPSSHGLYDSIVQCRTFDWFGRPVRDTEIDERNCNLFFSRKKAVEDERPDPIELFAQTRERVAEMASSSALPSMNALTCQRKEKLTTPVWKIGMKKPVYGPPGLAPPVGKIPESEGNEIYFSYDGEWKDGCMEGEGIYKFEDGFTYEGIFKRNVPDGKGKATYPGGTVYIGEWQNGYPHGQGRVTYRGGIVYEGSWKEGRREGEGAVTYPNGSGYRGEFQRGKYHGTGIFTSKASGGLTYAGSFKRGYVSGAAVITYPDGTRIHKVWPEDAETGMTLHGALVYIEEERKEEILSKKRIRQKLHGPIERDKLERHVEMVREANRAKREKERQEKIEERRRYIRETREAERARRASVDDESEDTEMA